MFYKILLSALFGLVFGMLCSNLAQKRGKNPLLWFQIGLFFGLFGLVFFIITLLIDKFRSSRSAPNPEMVAATSSTASNELLTQETPTLPNKTTLEDRDWYYIDQNQNKKGSISYQELKRLIEEKQIEESTYLWSPGMDKWKFLKDLSYLRLELGLDK